MPTIAWIIIGVTAAVALLVGAIVAASRAERKRREALAGVAGDMGLAFRGDEKPAALAGSTVPILQTGRSHFYRSVMTGTIEDLEVAIFDFQYTIGAGKNSSTVRQTVAAFALARPLPVFQVRPEHVFHKIGQAFGYQDIDLPEHPAFSKRFLLRGDDDEAIRGLFRPDVVACFEATKGLCVESDGRWLVVYRGSRVAAREFGAFVEEAFGVVNVLAG